MYWLVQIPDERQPYAVEIADDHRVVRGQQVVFAEEHVLELGRLVCRLTSRPDDFPVARLTRKATALDLRQVETNRNAAASAMRFFNRECASMHRNARARAVTAHFSLVRERLDLHYRTQKEVDQRQLVSRLQRHFGARVKLHQTGVRDEVSLLGAMAPCGRVTCCSSWLRHFSTVSVRMARDQNLSVNPSAINGTCGRLKCCLRFEHDFYLECQRTMPPTGAIMILPDGDQATVIGIDALKNQVKMRKADGMVVKLENDKVTRLTPAAPSPAAGPEGDRNHENTTDQRSEPEAAGET